MGSVCLNCVFTICKAGFYSGCSSFVVYSHHFHLDHSDFLSKTDFEFHNCAVFGRSHQQTLCTRSQQACTEALSISQFALTSGLSGLRCMGSSTLICGFVSASIELLSSIWSSSFILTKVSMVCCTPLHCHNFWSFCSCYGCLSLARHKT